MGILDEDVQRVREQTDLVALVSEYTGVKRVGRQHMARCPFHGEKTPSLSINNEMGVWYCFGCERRGDAISFVREIDHLDFVEAVERLAGRAGITLRYDDANYSAERKRKERLHQAVGAAIDFYHERLLSADDAGGARRYLRGRGFDGDAVRKFRLGHAPDSYEGLVRALHAQKFSSKELVDAGLAYENRSGRATDQFRDRLMFPIHDRSGKPVGFGARALVDGKGPKYKNSPENALYHKSSVLFWMHEAKSEAVARGNVIVCEGYTDVMAFVLAGHPNAVATCGTALTDDHFRALSNLAPVITLAYDADAAGRAAAERAYQWEQSSEVQFRIAALALGADPADAWRDDPEALDRAVGGATPFLQFRIDRILARADLASVEGRARAAELASDLIAEHPSELVRDQYAVKLADELQIDTNQIRRRATPGTRSASPRQVVDEVNATPIDRRELDALRWAVHAPTLVAGRLERFLFADPRTAAAFESLLAANTFAAAVADAPADVADVLQRLAAEDPGDETEAEVLVAHVIVNLVEAAGQRTRARLLRTGDDVVAELNSLLDTLAGARDAGEWSGAQVTAGHLVSWLAAREALADQSL